MSIRSTGLSKAERRRLRGRKSSRSSPPATADPPRFLRKADVARMLNVNPYTLDRWRKRPDLGFPPPIWLSSVTPAWRAEDIDAWLQTRPRTVLAPDWHTAGQR